MTRYAINVSPPSANSHRFLIGPPLFLVSLFCFAFVLMHPHDNAQAGTAASQPAATSIAKAKPSLPVANLPKVSQAQPVIITPNPVTTDPMATSTANTTSNLSTTASQSSSSTGSTANPQSAKENNQTTDNNQFKITVNSLLNSLKLNR
ncbi:MAG TPA: hypothetical protein VFC50_02185 [Candidatus Dormibacteraeota bacterium]|nr:hypothetical protein [Candidatus Dormibacteraeota bacterium]